MKELVEYVVKQLVTNPDAVTVEETTDGTSVNLLLKVDNADMGIVIGKAGQTIKSIRKLLLVKAISDGVRVNLQLHDENRPESEGQIKSDEIRASENADESVDPTSQAPQAIGSEAEPQAQARRDDAPEATEGEAEKTETDSTSQAPLNDGEKTEETPNPSTDVQDNKE